MSKSSKNKHYALSQMKELRQQYVEMIELGKRNRRSSLGLEFFRGVGNVFAMMLCG